MDWIKKQNFNRHCGSAKSGRGAALCIASPRYLPPVKVPGLAMTSEI